MAVEDGADDATVADEARRVLAASTYLTLATADADGRPWATPVWFASREWAEFVWVSRPGARHSVNLAARPGVGIAVFDPTVPVGTASAVYVEAEAAEVGPDDRVAALDVYNRRTGEQGLRRWTEQHVTGAAQFRLYRAVATHVWVLDEHDGRVEVDA
ncbi:pyridoxamine 5'-phosphate oxidase family protein [Cellulomonas cellasea]|uniref:Putative pyridoxine 5'-phosphate oxidase superfamily flavin-nucleotide-binding protein n=1 Tax=Cellulomonas cellasea TaxID=43670 RepID=A0A7W4Y9K9_9CELL|nr:pyridoxamine 5'-phosphate oxidase family protein [Cellulomonas cellasea]MBB2921790.1 putative pyridoxine 5'-phosphate oxidase superfamily flavin-nucleotide-binding protein [Cellulomonas cellasea]